jgi:putative transposase
MRKSKFSENQIITILKAVEAGRTVRDVCHEHEMSEAHLLPVEVEVWRHGSRGHSPLA